MKTPTAAAPLLACLAMLALARDDAKELQRFNTTAYIGVPFPPGLSEDVEALYREANAESSRTRSVRFRPYEWLEEDEQLAQIEWTWRVNVSELDTGGVATAGGNWSGGRPLAEPRVVNTVYDWSWPGGGDGAVPEGPVCVTGLLGFYIPANVTNAYGAAEAGSASCAPAFGASCVDAILRLSREAQSGDPQACAAVRPQEWIRTPECAGSWGYAARLQGGLGYVTVRFNAATDSAPGPVDTLASGQGFWSLRTEAFEAGEDRWLDGAVNRLHVLLVAAEVNTAGGVRSEPQLLCTRVGTEKLYESMDRFEDEEDDEGEGEGEGEGEDGDDSAGQILSSRGCWWYVALLAGMALVV